MLVCLRAYFSLVLLPSSARKEVAPVNKGHTLFTLNLPIDYDQAEVGNDLLAFSTLYSRQRRISQCQTCLIVSNFEPETPMNQNNNVERKCTTNGQST